MSNLFLAADVSWWERINIFISQPVISIVVRILAAFLILLIGLKIAKFIANRYEKSKAAAKLNKTVRNFLKNVIKIVLYVAVVLCALIVLGFELSVFSAALASVGVTVGLALQGGLSNIAGGVMVVAFKPFELGDYVEAAGVSGTVTDIGIFYTTLTTPDNKKVVVPNGTISNTVVTNYSTHETRRIDFDFTISYNASIDDAKRVLMACAKSDERILSDPAPAVMITSHGESAVGIRLRVWVKNSDYWDVNFAMQELVKRTFDDKGIEIPYNQLDVHISK
ncbi:MAG: mechanosensitive ion channel [Clostridia bacterium]|nr:mechanosensitive ion channel [Clostridia bacterium]